LSAAVLDPATDDGKKKIAAKKNDAIAVANLTIAFTNEETMALACESESTTWPSGLAHLTVKAVFGKHQPQDAMN
jgi:Na+-translocating ferredoxin:NAD+ oxidoreductase RnfC subunit